MSRFRPTRSAVLVTIALALVALMIAPVGALSVAHMGTAPLHPTAQRAAVSERAASPVFGAHRDGATSQFGKPALNVPAGNRVYQTQWSAISGDSQSGTIATDLATGTVYSVSDVSALLSAYNGFSGAPLRSTQLANDSTGARGVGIAFDNLSGNLYVAMIASSTGYLTVVHAATFAIVTNISFAATTVPLFNPGQLLFEWRTNQLLAENQSTQDIFAINTTTNTVATFLQIGCNGYAPSGCTSGFGMFDMNSSIGWIVVVPSGSSIAVVLSPSADPLSDAVAGSINGTAPGFLFGAGTFSNATGLTFFMNYTGDGTIAAWNFTGGFSGSALTGTGSAYALVSDPASGWLVLSTYNGAGFGDQVDLVSDFSGTVVATTSNASLPANDVITELAVFDAPNGTGYVTTASGFGPHGAELVLLLPATPPYGVVVTTYRSISSTMGDVVADPLTGLVYELQIGPNQLVAVSETTGQVAWTTPIPAGEAGNWLAVDAADSVLYVAGTVDTWAFSTTSGALLGTLATPWDPQDDAYGFGHLLYLTDSGNSTMQVYSTAGGAGTFVWTASLQLAIGSVPCSASASPVAEIVVNLACGLGHNLAQIDSVAAKGTIANVSGSPSGWAAEFNATGALFVGNDTFGNYGVEVFAAGTWAPLRFLPSPVPVEYLDFDPLVNGVLVGAFSAAPTGPLALLTATTGAVLATFHTPGTMGGLGVDQTDGTLVATSGGGQSFLANLLALPSAVSGLAAHAGNTTLNVTWTAATGPTGFPITSYTAYTSASATGPWTSAGSSATTSISVTGLTDGTTYYVTVRAVGGSGTGPSVAAVSGVPTGVPYPPSAVTAGTTTTSSIALSWVAPANDGGVVVTGYTVLDSKSATGPWTSVATGSGTTATVSSLSAGT
ncbi:MAG: fibronectin type III domain-containing protein, partial [Candidatus Lutacidiplasmatales archaeon]